MGTRLAKISGTLQELSGEELARQQGMEAPPVTPLGAVGVGASADVAKMSGTGEQVRAAIRETLKERTRETETMGEGERGAVRERFGVGRIQQQLGTLEGLGSLDNRIAEQIRARVLAAGEGGIKNTIDLEILRDVLSKGGTTSPGDAEVEAAAKELANLQSSATPEDVVKALAKLGISASIEETTESLAQKLVQTGVFKQATQDDIKALMDKTIQDNAQLTVAELGTDVPFDKNAVATVLNVDVTELDEWTLEEVKAGLRAYSSQNFTNVDELREVLASPAASQSQKDFARKRLAELGAVGVTSLEEKTDNLERQMEEGDTVRFGNTEVRISELLTNPKYKAVIAEALDDPEALSKLEETDKKLHDWIVTNKNSIKNIRTELAQGTADFIKLQQEYAAYVKDAPVDVLDKLVPGWRDAKGMPLEEWKAKLPPAIKNAFEDTTTNKAIKFSVLGTITAKMSADFANKFSATDLEAIVGAAGGDQARAASLAQDWIDSTPVQTAKFDWTPPNLGTGVDAVTTEEYNKIQAEILTSMGYSFPTIDAYVKKMNELAASASATDRSTAVKMFKDLGTLRTMVNTELSQGAIDKRVANKTADRVKKETSDLLTPIGNSLDAIIADLGKQSGHLKDQGLKVILPFQSELARLNTELVTKLSMGLSPEELNKELLNTQDKIKDVKSRLAGELAAFLFDENHWKKHTAAALKAITYIVKFNLVDSLSAQQRQSIRDIMDKTGYFTDEAGNPIDDVGRNMQEIVGKI